MRALLVNVSSEEGMYLDSKNTGFSASWQLVTLFDVILSASGMWRKVPERDAQGNNLWATSIQRLSMSQSWLPNPVDPSLDIIVDFGGG